MTTFGIDLGTTYSCIARYDEEFKRVDVVNNSEGESITPSVVYVNRDGEYVVGQQAVRQLTTKDAPRVIACTKREIADDGLCEADDFPYPMYKGKKLNPTTVSSMILKKLTLDNINVRNITKAATPEVVITFPAYFSQGARERTREAGENAGLKVVGMIEEPIAAAFSYGFDEKTRNKTVLVYDLGGGTFDVTIVQFDTKGKVSILEKYGDPMRGGIDWDNAFAYHIWKRYNETSPQELELSLEDFTRPTTENIPKLLTINRFRGKAKEAKHMLTDLSSVEVVCDDWGNEVHVTREEFDEVTRDLLNSTFAPIKELISNVEKIDKVLLVGGSTKMKQVRNGLEAEFPQFKGNVKLHDPDLAVAKGAALYAVAKSAEAHGMLSRAPEVVTVPKNIASKSYGLGCYRGDEDIYHITNLINVGDELPAVGEEPLFTREENQADVKIEVYESDEKNQIDENGNSLGVPIEMGNLISSEAKAIFYNPVPKGTPVHFRFELSEMGELRIIARPKNGKDLDFTLRLQGTGKGNRI